MKYKHSYGIAVGLVAVMAGSAAAPAAQIFSDQLCPAAAAPVIEYGKFIANPNAAVDDAVAAANRVVSAYDSCATGYRASGSVELVHYSQVRAAQYHFAAGHLQRLAEEYDAARASLNAALNGVRDTIDWTQASMAYASSNTRAETSTFKGTSSLNSAYHDSAVKIRDAAQAELRQFPGSLPAPSALPTP